MDHLKVASSQQKTAPAKKIEEASTICMNYGWVEEAEGLQSNPVFQEQEFLDWVPARD